MVGNEQTALGNFAGKIYGAAKNFQVGTRGAVHPQCARGMKIFGGT